jgi:acylphosphatase
MSKPGQVEVRVQGRLRVVQAFTRAGHEIPNQARVKVVDVLDQNTLIVEPLDTGGPTDAEEE